MWSGVEWSRVECSGVESVEWGLVGLSGLKWCPLECSARVGVGMRVG